MKKKRKITNINLFFALILLLIALFALFFSFSLNQEKENALAGELRSEGAFGESNKGFGSGVYGGGNYSFYTASSCSNNSDCKDICIESSFYSNGSCNNTKCNYKSASCQNKCLLPTGCVAKPSSSLSNPESFAPSSSLSNKTANTTSNTGSKIEKESPIPNITQEYIKKIVSTLIGKIIFYGLIILILLLIIIAFIKLAKNISNNRKIYK